MKTFLLGIMLSIFTGILITLSFPTWGYSYLLFFALIPFFLALHLSKNAKRPVILGLVFGCVAGFTTLLAGESWVAFTMQEFGGFSKPLAILVLILYCIVFGFSFGLFGALISWLKVKSKTSHLILYPIVYTSIEFLYPQLFPWYLGGSLYKKITFIQFVDITGMSGLTFYIVLINILFLKIAFSVYKPDKYRFPITGTFCAIFLSFAFFIYGHWRIINVQKHLDIAEPVSFSLVQTNVGNFEKSIETKSNLSVIAQVTRRNFHMAKMAALQFKSDMIVLPETAVPGSLNVNDKAKFEMSTLAQELKTNLYFGGYAEEERNIFNSAYYLNQNGEIQGRYDKVYLLMFGEFFPFSHTFPFLKDFIKEVSDFTAGTSIKNFPLKNEFLGPLICYEDIIPSFVRRIVKNGATILLNLANNSWFGESACPYQHLALSVFRSVENKVPLIRCTNTGISAFIDATGKIDRTSHLSKPEILNGEVKSPHIRTIYSEVGSVFSIMCSLFLGWIIFKSFHFKNRSGD